MRDHDVGTVLIVGASGLIGTAAANAFVDAGWSVLTASRRPPEFVRGDPHHVSLDLLDAASTRQAMSAHPNITHVVYAAVHELPGLIAGWSDPNQIDANDRMFTHLLEALVETGRLRHVSLLQGTKAYGAAVKPMRVPARESHARVPHANFYWAQEDTLIREAAAHGFEYTILRPQLVVGPNYGVVMNLPPVIGAYAAIRHAEGLPFSFPGGAEWVWEAVDARLVGEACVWATTQESAWRETFNLTNGEVFSFRDMWPALAATLGVDTGSDAPLDIAAYLTERASIWDEIVARDDLSAPPLADLLGESHHYANLCFAHGATTPPPATFVSTVKIREAGFHRVMNTEESFCHWLRILIERRILPSLKSRKAS